MRGAAIFDHADAAGRHLIDHAMIERDHAIGDIFLQAIAGQRAVAALAGHDHRDALFLQPAKEPAEFRAHDALIGQAGEKSFDRVEHHPLRLDRIDRVAEPDKEPFEIVFARLLEFAAIDEDVIEHQLLAGDERLQIEAQRGHIFGQFLARFFKCHEDARLIEFGGPAHEKLHGQQSLAATRAAANQRGPPRGQSATGDFIEPANAGTRLPQCFRTDECLRFHVDAQVIDLAFIIKIEIKPPRQCLK